MQFRLYHRRNHPGLAVSCLSHHGVNKPDWLRATRGTAGFLINNWSDEYGFGKAWDLETGECVDSQGTIGAYLIPGLAELYHVAGEVCYLEAARKACMFYRGRDLNRFECTSGALATYCIDKESSGPLLVGSLALYDINHSEEWLGCAKKLVGISVHGCSTMILYLMRYRTKASAHPEKAAPVYRA